MKAELRAIFLSLALMTFGVASMTAYVESHRKGPFPVERTPVAVAVNPSAMPMPPETPAPVEPRPGTPSATPVSVSAPASTAPAKPAPPSPAQEKPGLREITALPPLPAPKPRPVEPLLAKAKSGDSRAQFELGLAYAAKGDWKRAAAWYREAAIAGVPEARLRLGEQYRLGRGVPTDLLEAFIWTRSAAEKGISEAQLALGDAYERGAGIPPAPVEAYAWYATAAASGDAEAAHRRDALSKSFNAADRKAAEARAASVAAALSPSSAPSRHVVAEIQRLLRAQGYDVGLDDGFRGGRTTEAIRKYQEAKGLDVDGKVSEALLNKLRVAVKPPPTPPVE
jgi:localization factor PodJL